MRIIELINLRIRWAREKKYFYSQTNDLGFFFSDLIARLEQSNRDRHENGPYIIHQLTKLDISVISFLL